MTDKKAMQMALTILLEYYEKENGLWDRTEDAIDALLAALAQPDPEPVAYITKRKVGGTEGLLRADFVDRSEKNQETHYFIPLYKDPTPCQTCEALARTVILDQTSHDTKREWVGLTEDERMTAMENCTYDGGKVSWNLFGMAIEKKIKDKNHE